MISKELNNKLAYVSRFESSELLALYSAIINVHKYDHRLANEYNISRQNYYRGEAHATFMALNFYKPKKNKFYIKCLKEFQADAKHKAIKNEKSQFPIQLKEH